MTRSLPFLILFLISSCSSGPKPIPDGPKKGSLLDEPLDETEIAKKKKSSKTASLTEVMLMLPDLPKKMSRQIDGDTDDWNKKKFRKFSGKKFIEEGAEFWEGKSDTAMRVGIHSDGGWLYFAIEVKDDLIVDTKKGEEAVDSVVVTLRDPGLDLLERSLPKGVGLESYIDATTEITIFTDGRVRTSDKGLAKMIEAATDEKKNGYVVEVAIQLEAFEEVTTLPLDEIAFRVDVIDGDEPNRPGRQTVFSTIPSSFGTEKRFAKVSLEGLIPHSKIKGGPPREKAIGRWKYEDDSWRFVSFEVTPKLWVTIEDPSSFETALQDDDVWADVCNTARKDIKLIEAYQSRGGSFRVGLIVCGQRAVKGKCSKKAKTRVMFVRLEPDDESWAVTESFSVFEKTLKQCTNDPIKDREYYRDFSLFPLDMLGDSFWVVGWTLAEKAKLIDFEQYGVTFLNTKADEPRVGLLPTDSVRVDWETRDFTRSHTYLTNIDDDNTIDICQIERNEEQYCASFKRGCKTRQRGKSFRTNIFLWDRKSERFEKHILSKHKNCGTQFKFAEKKAYLILQLQNRVGLLPSPTLSKDGEEGDELDIF